MEEQVEVIDDNFNVLKVVPRDEIRDKSLKHKAVAIIVKNSKDQFYVAQRSSTKKVFPLKWETGAGGAVSAGESFEDAAKRELKEELGFEAELKYLFDFDWNEEFNNYKAKIYIVNYDGDIILNKEDFEQAKWVSVEEMEEMIKDNLICTDTAAFTKKYLNEFFRK